MRCDSIEIARKWTSCWGHDSRWDVERISWHERQMNENAAKLWRGGGGVRDELGRSAGWSCVVAFVESKVIFNEWQRQSWRSHTRLPAKCQRYWSAGQNVVNASLATWPDELISSQSPTGGTWSFKLWDLSSPTWFICGKSDKLNKFSIQRTSKAFNDQFRPSEWIQLLCVDAGGITDGNVFSKWFACVYIFWLCQPTHLASSWRSEAPP